MKKYKEFMIDYSPVLTAILFVIIIFGSGAIIATTAGNNIEKKRQTLIDKLSFDVGDIVVMKAFGHVGMVIQRNCGTKTCSYHVRFSAIKSSTQSHIFGSGGNIDTSPVSLVRNIREFELELYDE